MLHMARYFQVSRQDCVAARKDLELKIRLLSAVSIGFRGLEAQLQVTLKNGRNSIFQVEIFIGDFGRRLFAFCPDCGECFAPPFLCLLELCFQTQEANTDSTQESYFQLQIFPGSDAVLRLNFEVALQWKIFL